MVVCDVIAKMVDHAALPKVVLHHHVKILVKLLMFVVLSVMMILIMIMTMIIRKKHV